MTVTATDTMRAAKAFDFDDVRIVDLPKPAIGAKEALVRVATCGICSGDVTPWYIRKKCPIVIGHEPVGTIVELGPEASTRFSVGDRVFIHHHAPCHQCRLCKRGFFSMCTTWRSSNLDPGGMAEYVRIPQVNLEHDTLILPPDMSFRQGALIEPIACVVKAFKRARFQPGDRVAVIGLGFIGQVMVRLAQHLGAETVLASDLVDFRLKRALELGADAVFNPAAQEGTFPEFVASHTEGLGADLVLVGPSSTKVIQEGIKCAAPGSRVLMFMAPQPGVMMEVEPNELFFKEIDLVSSYSCGPDDTRETLALIHQGVFPVDKLVTHSFPMNQALEACRLTAAAAESLKVLVDVTPGDLDS
jgi:L-iditol 2-dehydrogenase